MENETVLYKVENRIGFITLNRPHIMNALSREVFSKLGALLDQIAIDDRVGAIVITGAEGVFTAGADVNELSLLDTVDGWSTSRARQSVFTKIEGLGKPSIAAINGICLGGGLELALSCTFRVASTHSRIGFPEIKLGIITGFGGTKRAMRIIGYGRTAEMLLFSTIIDGEQACRIGLVHRAVKAEDVLKTAGEMAAYLCTLSPVAVRLGLELLLESESTDIGAGLALESALAALAVSSKEAKQSIGDFLSKGSVKATAKQRMETC